jgi:NDP-sugar pyrophosphorylase family protein
MAASERGNPRALLLTAGLGTRLTPLTYLRAKAVVPVNGQPLVHRVIRWLAAAGVRDLVLNLHHRPATITSRIGDGHDLGVRVRYSWEQPVLGSAGGPRRALPLLTDGDASTFLIVNGDTLTNLDLQAMIARHRDSGALVTMALIKHDIAKYGGVQVSPDGWVTGFARRGSSAADAYHFIGVQVADARVFATLDDGVLLETVNWLYPRLIAEHPRAIAGYVSDATFLDIGTPRDCLDSSLAIAASEGARFIGERATIANSAVLTRTVLWDDVTIGARARLHDCVVGDGVVVPPDTVLERCAVVPADGRTPQADERLVDGLLIRSL